MRKKILFILLGGMLTLTGCNANTESGEVAKLEKELKEVKQELQEYKDQYGEIDGSGSVSEEVSSDEQSKESNNNTGPVTISSKNLHPALYEADGLYVAMEGCEYTEGVSDLRITLAVKNESNNIIGIDFTDIKIGDAQFELMFDSISYEVGSSVTSNFYVSGDDINAADVAGFDKMICNLKINILEGENIFSKELVINKDAFVNFE